MRMKVSEWIYTHSPCESFGSFVNNLIYVLVYVTHNAVYWANARKAIGLEFSGMRA